jgi:uncharacterized protein
MHVEISDGAMDRVIKLLPELTYDICVLTGDFRAKTYGPFDATLAGIARVRSHITGPLYGVLGNHDTVQMVRGLEAMGIRMLLNESEGSPEAMSVFTWRASTMRTTTPSITLKKWPLRSRNTHFRSCSRTRPRSAQRAHAWWADLLTGIYSDYSRRLPRRMGAGAWQYHEMAGYTSVGAGSCVVPVRFNARPPSRCIGYRRYRLNKGGRVSRICRAPER